MTKKIISISIPKETYEKLKEKSKKTGTSVSSLINLILIGENKLNEKK